MNCSRCGAAEAVVKRDAAFYCGRCALARDWEEVIALVQEERVDMGPVVDFGGEATVSAGTPALHTTLSNGDSPADPFA